MKIYTSYFANLKNLELAGLYCVSICNKVPTFFKGPNIESVAPTNSILSEIKKSEHTAEDEERYKQRYINEVLCAYRFHPEYLINLLTYFSSQEDNKDIALLCYERPEDFCHRHILAEWLNERIPGLNIEEYPVYCRSKEKEEQKLELRKKKEKAIEENTIQQNTLF
jgi:uncharacterized protein YeaO (DUF488 family)